MTFNAHASTLHSRCARLGTGTRRRPAQRRASPLHQVRLLLERLHPHTDSVHCQNKLCVATVTQAHAYTLLISMHVQQPSGGLRHKQ